MRLPLSFLGTGLGLLVLAAVTGERLTGEGHPALAAEALLDREARPSSPVSNIIEDELLGNAGY